MTNLIEITLEEEGYVSKSNARLTERAKHTVTIERLLEDWHAFAQEVEEGYNWTSYEYANDLSLREILDEVMAEAPITLRDKLRRVLEEPDARFYAATREIDRAMGFGLTKKTHPLWFRIPKRLCPELESDLRARGLLD
ncbi:MAG: hypothetical protein NTZ05_13780 [Chloroflexi bacterium]|nr:hypothetical protein [Chloroflexota bacterium]